MKGNLFIISGPSGVGKTSLVKPLKKLVPELKRVVTCTTRKPRPQEKEGVDFFYYSVDEFKKLIEQDAFLEYAKVHTDYYGTPYESVRKMLDQGKQIYLVIDVQGAKQVKERIPETVLIFIEPESMDVLKKRLEKRKSITPEALKKRLDNANKEMAQKEWYDHSVVNYNGKLKETAKNVAKIMKKYIEVDK